MDETAICERLARIEEQLKTIFSRINSLPCKDNTEALAELKRQSYAASKIVAALIAIGGVVFGVVEVLLRVLKDRS